MRDSMSEIRYKILGALMRALVALWLLLTGQIH